jgi:hypothetical protein
MTTPFDRMRDACQEHPEAINYKRYTEIPVDLKTESFVIAWIVSGGKLVEVPVGDRTEEMLTVAVSHDDSAFEIINPSDVSNYQALILDAIANNPSCMADVPQQYITEDLIIKAAEKRIGSLGYVDFKRKYKHLLTDTLISAIASRNVSSAVSFGLELCAEDRSRIQDGDLITAIKAQVNDLQYLKAIGKSHLLADLLGTGYWPDNLNAAIKMEKGQQLDISLPPGSPHEAMSRLASMGSPGVRFLHLQSLRCFPIEEVISTTQDIPKGVNHLLEVYTEDELRPHMRLSRPLRARLLENALGL